MAPPYKLHLRRLSCTKTRPETDQALTLILLDEITTVGRTPDKCHLVLTSNGVSQHSNMISRHHADIFARKTTTGEFVSYSVTDKSLNGTYINEHRIGKATEIKEGDVIKFGHLNGAAVKPGMHAPQVQAEFAFIVERWNPSIKYPGCNSKGVRERQLYCSGSSMALNDGNRIDEMNAGDPSARKLTSPGQLPLSYQQHTAPDFFQTYLQLMQQPHSAAAVNMLQLSSNMPTPTAGATMMNSMAMMPSQRQPAHYTHTAIRYNEAASPGVNVDSFSFYQPLPQGMDRQITALLQHAHSFRLNELPTSTQGSEVTTVPIAPSSSSESMEKKKVASPPMECDSSVPSPPKNAPPDRVDVSRRSSISSNGDDVDVGENDEYQAAPVAPIERRSPSPKKTEPKKKAKNNEVAMLLDAQTETSWVNQRKVAGTSHRRPTDEDLVEELAKKKKKKDDEKTAVKEPTKPPVKTTTKTTAKNAVLEQRSKLKQISDESDVSTSESEADEKKKKPVKSKTIAKGMMEKSPSPPPKAKRQTATEQKKKTQQKRQRDPAPDSDSEDDSKQKRKKKAAAAKKGGKKGAQSKNKKDWDYDSGRDEEDDDETYEAVATTSRKPRGSKKVEKDLDKSKEMRCAMPRCKPVLAPIGEFLWVACDDCHAWFHTWCKLGEHITFREEDPWNCGNCGRKPKQRIN